ncbi:MAG: DNA-directed RNA polymerase subunit beta', partial [Chloroflexi bacterium]|nr:DNA-directed RNA polymerase subunit beta' [Chloroflexota bacterium]
KRVRFKGIVCDKCGVEVARAKVRRERMGHIELASPVSHIWYFKGTPSRLGVLLDISPRNLEKVLYFASYITISVDAEARQRAIEGIEAAVAERSTQVDVATTEQQRVLETQVQAEFDRLDAEKRQRIAELTMGVAPMAGGSEGDAVDAETQPSGALGGTQLEDEVRRIDSETDREKERIRAVANAEIDALARKMNEEIEALEASIQSKKDSVDKIAPMQFLTDTQYRELQDVAPGIFRAGMGAEAILEIIRELDLETLSAQLRHDVHSSSSQKRKKAIKRLRVVENFRRSAQKAKPEWMILTVLPVLPPDLRPMVQLDGGRFATSDLNDLYRRVINRNNRLKRLLELGAPEIIIRNEKRMLQEACDALIDNGRRGRAVAGSTNHKLKSLSDMLRGKQGRFRQNLLGKRVDYSGRSVIVVGPDLKLHQCGLPKKMALELFKPFVMRKLVEHGHAPNIKSAKRVVERGRGEVWDVLEEVIQGHPVLLNRAPTLHRLGIQAFDPVLVEGSAIQIHPLVCTAFNADFDGDQMAVHVPLSEQSQREARELMMANNNLLSPASGEPIVAPTKDMVVGLYYLTLERDGMVGEDRVFGSFGEAILAHDLGMVDLHAKVRVRVTDEDFPEPPVAAGVTYGWSELFPTTVGRIILNSVLPKRLRFYNDILDKTKVKVLITKSLFLSGDQNVAQSERFHETAEVVDRLKYLGFRYATISGITMAVGDIHIPVRKKQIVSEAEDATLLAERNFNKGLITDGEKSSKLVDIWTSAMADVERAVKDEMFEDGPVHMMASSGAAKGGFQQIRQIAGMRGLMADTKGRLKEGLPVKSNFREGLMPLEYFLSTHGARKGLADTAMKTAEAGYLTRRLIDVAQDVGVRAHDCGTSFGIWKEVKGRPAPEGDVPDRPPPTGGLAEAFHRDLHTIFGPEENAVFGRTVLEWPPFPRATIERLSWWLMEERKKPDQAAKSDDALILEGLGWEVGGNLDLEALQLLREMQPEGFRIRVRSPLTCELRYGVCSKCYGQNLATGKSASDGDAVGIIAAQSIGEP